MWITRKNSITDIIIHIEAIKHFAVKYKTQINIILFFCVNYKNENIPILLKLFNTIRIIFNWMGLNITSKELVLN